MSKTIQCVLMYSFVFLVVHVVLECEVVLFLNVPRMHACLHVLRGSEMRPRRVGSIDSRGHELNKHFFQKPAKTTEMISIGVLCLSSVIKTATTSIALPYNNNQLQQWKQIALQTLFCIFDLT